MQDCIFCKIIAGEVTAENIIFSTEECIVFLDKYRVSSVGAICLVVPKQHLADITELHENVGSNLMMTIKQTAILLKTTFHAKGIRIWQANGRAAGQSVNHLHFHIVPCNSVWDRIIALFPIAFDVFRRHNIFSKNKQINNTTLQNYAKQLRENYKNIG